MVLTAREVPVVVVTSAESQEDWRDQLTGLGVEVWVLGRNNITEFLNEAGRRGWTRVLVEGGGSLLGAFLDKDAVDELHLYQAPILVGGAHSRSAFGGEGRPQIASAWRGRVVEELLLGDDRFVRMVRK
jgi:diaminohydroxyphosphoribosylaminopyrimidine deaminase/5-amino-6-(5-phosphoribosylamino)uracil reductase